MSEPEASTDDKLIGEVLANRYQIEARLGEGAMGTVYRARHVKVGRQFAVKVLHPDLLRDLKFAKRFEQEAELAGRLRHPNVIGVVDVGETSEGLRYMVMDFANGVDLATLISAGAPFTPTRIVHLTKQLLDGLYHAHEAGLIHRDFKPENVIVERDDHGAETPRIVDFGIAILREAGDPETSTGRLTTSGLVLGTPYYMAPEQAVADPLDHRVDLFALGIVLYEMLCGRLPFDGSGAEVARANLMLDPPPISQRVPHLAIDPLLEAFARSLLAKRRDNRPATAKAARDLLELVDRDRAAAAAALGLAPAAVVVPQTTETSAAIQPDPEVRSGTDELTEAVVDDRANIAVTPISDDGDAPRPSRRGWVAAGVAAVAAVATVAIIATTMRTDGEKPGAGEPHVAPVVVPRPDPQPIATPDPPADDGSSSDRPPTEVPRLDDPPVATQVPRPKAGKPRAVVARNGDRPVSAPNPDPLPAPRPPTPPQAAAPPSTPAVTSTALVATYTSVGRDLKALGDKAVDLWPRYRMIRLNEALATPQSRAAAATILSRLEREAASRR